MGGTRGWLRQRAGLPCLNCGRDATAVTVKNKKHNRHQQCIYIAVQTSEILSSNTVTAVADRKGWKGGGHPERHLEGRHFSYKVIFYFIIFYFIYIFCLAKVLPL